MNSVSKLLLRQTSGHNCVRMISVSSPIGQWTDQICGKKAIVVCQKTPTVTINCLYKNYWKVD